VEAYEIDDLFEDFDREYYRSANADLKTLLTDPLWYFLLMGWNEDRLVAPAMRTADFLSSCDRARSFIIYLNDVGMDYNCQNLRWKFFDWQIQMVKQIDRRMKLSNMRFIRLVYQIILRREPDPEGLQTFLSFLFDQKYSKEEVLEIIADSNEAYTKWRLEPIFPPPLPNESPVQANVAVEVDMPKALRVA